MKISTKTNIRGMALWFSLIILPNHLVLAETTDLENELEWLRAETYVVTASKKREHIYEAPANISVLTRQDIEELGVSDLWEALSYLPGITVVETYWGYTDVIFRGNYQEHYNNKSLFMINGHPFWGGAYASYHLDSIPLDAIKQVEVIRGPGSVLYGTNAYAGVINIITNTGDDTSGGKASVRLGSFSTKEISASYGQNSAGIDYFISAQYRDNDGYPYNIDNDELGGSTTFNYENDLKNVFASISFSGLEVHAAYFKKEKQKFGVIPIIGWGGITTYDGYYVNVKYSKPISNTVTLSFNAFTDKIENDIILDNFASFGRGIAVNGGGKTGMEILGSYQPDDALFINFGLAYTKYQTDPYVAYQTSTGDIITSLTPYDFPKDTMENSAYIQADYMTSHNAKYVIGLRYTDNERAGHDISPNIGAVYKVSEDGTLKILYGEAFRSPNFFEQFAEAAPPILGDPLLTAEEIKTLDIIFDYQLFSGYRLITNFFTLSTWNTIERIPANPPYALKYVNGQGHTIRGIELALDGKMTRDISLIANLTSKRGKQKSNQLDVPYLTKIHANFGANWKLSNKLSASSAIQYVGKRKDNDSAVSIAAYELINFQLIYTVKKNHKLFFTINNLLDKDYTYPEFIRENIDDIPGGPDRAFYVKIEFPI